MTFRNKGENASGAHHKEVIIQGSMTCILTTDRAAIRVVHFFYVRFG